MPYCHMVLLGTLSSVKYGVVVYNFTLKQCECLSPSSQNIYLLKDSIVLPIYILILMMPMAGANRGLTGTITCFLKCESRVYTKTLVPYNLTLTKLSFGSSAFIYLCSSCSCFKVDQPCFCYCDCYDDFYAYLGDINAFSLSRSVTRTACSLLFLARESGYELNSSGSKQMDYLFSRLAGTSLIYTLVVAPYCVIVPYPILSMNTMSLMLNVVQLDIWDTLLLLKNIKLSSSSWQFQKQTFSVNNIFTDHFVTKIPTSKESLVFQLSYQLQQQYHLCLSMIANNSRSDNNYFIVNMGACNTKSRKITRYSAQDSTISKEQTDTQIGNACDEEIKNLRLIYRDLSLRTESRLMDSKTLQIFFHMSSIWGASLFRKFSQKNSDAKFISQDNFIRSVIKYFKEGSEEKLKFLFCLYDLDSSKGVSFNELLAVLLNSPEEELKQILSKDQFIKTLTFDEISYYLSSSKKADRGISCEQYRNSLTLFPHLRIRKRSTSVWDAEMFQSCNKNESKAETAPEDLKLRKYSSRRQPLQQIPREELEELFKNKINKCLCATQLLRKYAEFVFKKNGLNKQNNQIHFENFKGFIKQHPKVYHQCFEGFHQYLWFYAEGEPIYKKLVPLISGECVEVMQKQNQRQVFLAHMKNSLMVFGDKSMNNLLQIKNLQGLSIEQTKINQRFGFVLNHKDGFYPQYCYLFQTKEEQQNWLKSLKQFQELNVFKFYTIGEKIGKGSFCNVFTCTNISTKQKRAMKIIDKTARTPQQIEAVNYESSMLATCVMDSVVRAYERFQSKNSIFLIMELLDQGTLYEHVKKNNRNNLLEAQAKQIMKDLLNTVKKLHEIGIIHRDLKLQNILMKQHQGKKKAKIIDFGLAIYKIDLANMEEKKKFVGTPNFVAPEIFYHDQYNEAIDIFSLGVIMHFLLTGTLPFNAINLNTIRELTIECFVNFENKKWEQVSEEAKDLVGQMISYKEYRIDAENALKHQWFKQLNPEGP